MLKLAVKLKLVMELKLASELKLSGTEAGRPLHIKSAFYILENELKKMGSFFLCPLYWT